VIAIFIFHPNLCCSALHHPFVDHVLIQGPWAVARWLARFLPRNDWLFVKNCILPKNGVRTEAAATTADFAKKILEA
jgi:hypothetical protein